MLIAAEKQGVTTPTASRNSYEWKEPKSTELFVLFCFVLICLTRGI